MHPNFSFHQERKIRQLKYDILLIKTHLITEMIKCGGKCILEFSGLSNSVAQECHLPRQRLTTHWPCPQTRSLHSARWLRPQSWPGETAAYLAVPLLAPPVKGRETFPRSPPLVPHMPVGTRSYPRVVRVWLLRIQSPAGHRAAFPGGGELSVRVWVTGLKEGMGAIEANILIEFRIFPDRNWWQEDGLWLMSAVFLLWAFECLKFYCYIKLFINSVTVITFYTFQ